MSLNNFIPELWADALEHATQQKLVYAQDAVINNKYEGQIRKLGNTVRINMVGDPTIGDYTKDTDISSPEALTDAQATLTITQQKYFNFQVDDIDEIQGNPAVMGEAMDRSAYKLAQKIDQYVAALYTDISTTIGSTGSPKTVGVGATDANAYQLLVDVNVALDEQDVPDDGRWVVVPPWYYGLLQKDVRFSSYGTPANRGTAANGEVGMFMSNLRVLKSNNVPTSSTHYFIIAGHPMAWSFAMQNSQVEAYRPEKRFADAVKGLQLYGGKVIRPNLLVNMTADKGTL